MRKWVNKVRKGMNSQLAINQEPVAKSFIRSWNCPWMSPQTITGLFTGWTSFDSSMRISFTWTTSKADRGYTQTPPADAAKEIVFPLHLPPPTKNPSTTAAQAVRSRATALDSNEVIKTLRGGTSYSKGRELTYSQRDWSSCSARCWPSLTLEIHRSKSMAGRRPTGWERLGAEGLGGSVEPWREEETLSWLLAPPRSRRGGGRREGNEERGRGAGGEVVICAWLFGRLAGVDERLGWLAHSLVLAAARGDGASSSVSIFFWDWMELCLGTKRQARNVSKNLTFWQHWNQNSEIFYQL